MSVMNLVRNRLKRIKKGQPFAINGFYSLGTHSSVQKAFSRLANEEEVSRLAKGFYVRPKRNPLLPKVKFLSGAEQLARKWAKENGHTLTVTSFEAAYRAGFQKQAPVKKAFWTSGPSRSFRIGNEEVAVIHKGNTKLLRPNSPEGVLYRATLEVAPNIINQNHLKQAVKRLETRQSSKEIVTRLMKMPLSIAWRNKLESLKIE